MVCSHEKKCRMTQLGRTIKIGSFSKMVTQQKNRFSCVQTDLKMCGWQFLRQEHVAGATTGNHGGISWRRGEVTYVKGLLTRNTKIRSYDVAATTKIRIDSHCVAQRRTMSHNVARCRTTSHDVAQRRTTSHDVAQRRTMSHNVARPKFPFRVNRP
jgi:hypothetical protein